MIGWFDTWERANASKCTFCFFVGGRGIGKTYSALQGHLKHFPVDIGKLVYLRLTGAEIDGAGTAEENPYKRINHDTGLNVEFLPVKKAYTIAKVTRDENNSIIDSIPIGTGRSLASFHNLRGVDFYDYDIIYFDEFIPAEATRRTPEIKRAGYLFAQAYETINRNRELLGQPPVKVIFTANAFSLDSAILNDFGIVKTIQMMQERGQYRYTDIERSIYIEICQANDITEKKAQTAIYKAMRSKQFVNVSLKNSFDDYALTLIKKTVHLTEYRPIVAIPDITFYQHKSSGELWAAQRCETAAATYSAAAMAKFKRKYKTVIKAAIEERVIFFDNADTYYKIMALLA